MGLFRPRSRPHRHRKPKMPTRRIEITCCNIKKLDTKFYNLEKPRCWVTVKLGEQTYTTQVGIGLDPTWEEEVQFEGPTPRSRRSRASSTSSARRTATSSSSATCRLSPSTSSS